jgi:diphosphomevalonate decarboxylase
MNLAGLESRTTVMFDPGLKADCLILNHTEANQQAQTRVSKFLDHIRSLAGIKTYAKIDSTNNFPTGTGIASSSSAFAALALAASAAAQLDLDEPSLSRLARLGSGSASRSVPAGFVEWVPGSSSEDSYSHSIAHPEHWAITDCVAIISETHKDTGSTQGHRLAESSPFQRMRVKNAPQRIDICKRAILERDFESLASIAEYDCNLMHAVMMTTSPPTLYWHPATLEVIKAVQEWRTQNIPAFYTIDAGPNVHVICLSEYSDQVSTLLTLIDGVVKVLTAQPGGPAQLVNLETIS